MLRQFADEDVKEERLFIAEVGGVTGGGVAIGRGGG